MTLSVELEQLNPKQFDRFCTFIYRASGIRIGDNKLTLLSNRIRRRLQPGQDFEAYYQLLTSPDGRGELEYFLDAITTNETFFFRSDAHFDWLRTTFLADLVDAERAGRRSKSLRVWSAGCATGAEPYTIAICLLENLYRLRDWSMRIIGTDISEAALREARAGAFRPRAIEAVSDTQLKRFFTPEQADGRRAVRPDVRELITFDNHNLMTPMSAPPFDCVFIRNVLIYFDRASKEKVVKHLIDALAPGGYLVVGPSEGIFTMLDDLERCSTFLYRKPGAS